MGFAPSTMTLASPAFKAGAAIPRRHTGEGEDLSPALAWRDAPAGTRGFALFCHDPDAPLVTPIGAYGFVHWVLYNIPATAHGLAEACTDHTHGLSDFGRPGYGGPLPPPGHGVHHYYFWLLALKEPTALPPHLRLGDVLAKIEPLVIGMNRLVGTYQRG